MYLLKGSNGTSRLFALVFVSVFLISLGITHHAFADSVVATIPVGTNPTDIAVNPVTDKVYVANSGSNTVSVINGSTNSVMDTISGFYQPMGVAVNPATDMIYVLNPPYNNVTVVNGATDTIMQTIQMPHAGGGGWWDVEDAVNPVSNKVYVTWGNIEHLGRVGGVTCCVSVIDGSTNTVANTISNLNGTGWIKVNPNTNTIYVTNPKNDSITVIDGATNDVVSTIKVAATPRGLAVNDDTNKIYVPNGSYYDSTGHLVCGNTTSVIDGYTNTVQSTVKVGKCPGGVDVNPNTDKIYVANSPDSTVSVIDGRTNVVTDTLNVGYAAFGVAVNPNTNLIYVTNYYDNTVHVIQGSPPSVATVSQLQVNSQDSYNNTLPGFYTELYAQNGTQLDTGYTPYNFTLDNGQNYTVHVEDYGTYKFNHWADTGSTNASRTMSISNDAQITAVYATIPTHPSNLTATAVSSSEIDLSWNAPTSDGGSPITGYRIQQSTDDSTWTTIVKNTGNTSTAYNDTGLSDNTTYYYRVFALNSVGSSYRSNVASATTPILSVAGTNVGPITTALP